MWANWEIADLLEWLKQRNSSLSVDKQIGFYGLDVYSLYESLESIMKFVKELKDPDAIEAATAVYQCF
jgi:erythromycin esterase-like protein